MLTEALQDQVFLRVCVRVGTYCNPTALNLHLKPGARLTRIWVKNVEVRLQVRDEDGK